jgi:hypothetical protein
MKKIYNINWNRFVLQLLPTPLRHGTHIAWLQALLWPVVQLYRRFLHYMAQTRYRLMITPQVCYLERMLNDRFDPIQRRIYIADGQDQQPVYVYLPAELKPLHLGSAWIYSQGEAGELKNDFVIHVPQGLAYDAAEMRASVNVYKLAGTRYSIQAI